LLSSEIRCIVLPDFISSAGTLSFEIQSFCSASSFPHICDEMLARELPRHDDGIVDVRDLVCSGTSAAAPFVIGAIALYWEEPQVKEQPTTPPVVDSAQDKSLSGQEKESGSENDQPVPFPQPNVDTSGKIDWPPE
jgi:hypothetical protein